MECTGIKDLLSEYIDGGLDSQTMAAIDEHLLTCRSCNEESVSLRTLVKELGSLDQVKAPDDFLERLYERMAPRFTLEKVMRILFFPLRIKIPLELATATVVAILVFSILSIQHPEKMISQAPEKSTGARIAKDNITRTVDATLKEDTYKSQHLLKEKSVQSPAKKGEIIELALLIKGEEPGEAYKSNEAPIRMRRSAKSRGIAIPARPVPPNIEIESHTFEMEDEAVRSAAKGSSARKEKSGSSLSPLSDTFLKVKDLIGSMNGTIESIKYNVETGRPASIDAKIPTKNYNTFCNNLKGIATLQAPPPAISEKDPAPVQIHITFISSE